MGQHFVKVVEDGTLGTECGWTFAEPDDAEDIYFIAERSAMQDEQKLNDAWGAAQSLVIERAVREGIVQYVDDEQAAPEVPREQGIGDDPPPGGRRVAI